MKLKVLPKALSVLVSAALILMAPGPAAYEALAGEIKTTSGEIPKAPTPTAQVGVPAIGNIDVPVTPQTVAMPSVLETNAVPQELAANAVPVAAAEGAPALVMPAPLSQAQVEPAAPGAAKDASQGLKAGTESIGALQNGDAAKVLADPKAEKSGVLNWIFDRFKGGKKEDEAVVMGSEAAVAAQSNLAPATPRENPARPSVPAPLKTKPAAPAPKPAARNRPYRLIGVAAGTALAFAAFAAAPMVALALPIVGYGLGGAMKLVDPKSHIEEAGTGTGVVLGTLAAGALVFFGVMPLTYALAIPLAAAIIGYAVGAMTSKNSKADEAKIARREPTLSLPDAVKKMDAAHGIVAEKQAVLPEAPKQTEPAATPKPEEKKAEAIAPAAKIEEKKAEVPAAAKTEEENETLAPGKTPRSFKKLPADAREKTLDDLFAAKVKAQERARKIAKSAQLVSVAINLDDDRAHWIFTFRSKSRKITIYEKSSTSVRLKASEKTGPVLWNTRFQNAGTLEQAYTALKKEKHWFKPVRVELRPTWKGDPYYLFIDKDGREAKVPSAAQKKTPEPAPAPPADRGPPQTEPAPAGNQTPTVPPAVPTKSGPATNPAPPETKTPDTKPPETKPPAQEPPTAAKYNPISEGFFGFRWVKGIERTKPDGSKLGRLKATASASEIIDQIAWQFDIPRADVVALGKKLGFTEVSPAAQWFGVYDKLQQTNKAKRDHYDNEKHEGSVFGELFAHGLSYLPMPKSWKEKLRSTQGSFRKLSNRSYPPGLGGALLRLLEVHKHVVGAFFRFPYHLFDMFAYGYFRRNISFEFLHSAEDYLNIEKPGSAIKHLEAAMHEQARKGSGFFGTINGSPAGRTLNRWLITPIVSPLWTFIKRRGTMALFSAATMGVLGAIAPGLAIMSFSLTALPLVGPALVGLSHGLPVAVASFPLVGAFLAPVVAAATMALLKDMIVGRLLNTMLLSTAMTVTSVFPNALTQERIKMQEADPKVRPDRVVAAARVLKSGKFWWTLAKQNWNSFVGMVTVGAEIEGIMTYMHGIDATVSDTLGSKIPSLKGFDGFQKIGALVEKPAEWVDEGGVKHHNMIPFGGAITWGNTLLYKAETAVGYNLSDHIMWALNPSLRDAKVTAQQVIQMTTQRPDQAKAAKDKDKDGKVKPSVYDFDKDLFKKSPEEIKARIAELIKQSGGLEGEIKATKEWQAQLAARLKAAEQHVKDIEAKRESIPPLTDAERAEYARLMKELSGKRDEGYIDSKLAERHDILHPNGDDLAKLQQLKALKEYYDSAIGAPPNGGRTGYTDQLMVQQASLGALKEHLTALQSNRPTDRNEGKVAPVDAKVKDDLERTVTLIEKLRTEAQGEMANRDAVRQLLAVENKERNRALDDRRSGKEMFELHKNMSRLATVMDMALALNEINAAEKAITQMQQLLNQRLAAIQASQQQNQQNLNNANNQAGQIAQWTQQATATVNSDKASQQTMVTNEAEARGGVQRIGAFQSGVSGLIAQINASDKGQSATAAAEYQRRINLLPAVAQFRNDGVMRPGINPGAAGGFSMKQFTDLLAQVQGNIQTANNGVAQLPTVPVEFAGALIVLIPGPAVNVTNPTQAQTLQILADRDTYWAGQQTTIQNALTTVNKMLDPSNTATTTDEFGNVNPQSLPVWRGQQAALETQNQSQAQTLLSQVDALASDVNAKLGATLPPLSGLPLASLQTALQSYATKVQAVTIPNTQTPDVNAASLEILEIAQLLPQAAHNVIIWSQADGTIKQIDNATANTLPTTQAKLNEMVQMFNNIVADDAADVAFVKGTSGESSQALINRKTDLLKNKILVPLNDAQTLLQSVLIPYQQSSIDSAQSNPNQPLDELFTAQLNLINQTQSLYNTTVPWAVTTHGGANGNAADSHTHIAAWRTTLQNNLNGYTDSSGNKIEGLLQYQTEVNNRKDPNYAGTENLYGETQPYSLPKKIVQYTAEEVTRASAINTDDAQINAILTQIQTLSNGQYNMASYMLPTGITPDAAGVAKANAVVNANTITNLAAQLKTIGNAATGSGGLTIGLSGGNGTVPVGTQPPITVTNAQKISLLALDAARRLAPSALQINNPSDTSASYAFARLIYANAVVTAAQTALAPGGEVDQATKFINDGIKAVNDAIANTQAEDAYVNSNGTGETPDHVFAREVGSYTELDTFLKEGVSFFGYLTTQDQGAFSTINQINTYYSSLQQIYSGGQTVNGGEMQGYQQMSAALQSTLTSLEADRSKVTSWLSQLDDPHDSALRRINENISDLQVKTRSVLEANVKYHDLEDQVSRSENILKSELTQVDEQQNILKDILAKNDLQDKLPPDLVARIDKLRLGRGMWEMGSGSGADASAAIVIKKSEFGHFVDSVLGLFAAQNPDQNLGAIKSDILSNPSSLAGLIPNSRVVDFGDNADGFYMVYQSNFAVPGGLNTGTWVTLGNVAKVWGNNVSVTGYQFGSPPEVQSVDGASNAPYGDKGVEVQIESLQGKNYVNYLNIDLHRFAFSIPPDNGITNQAQQSRMMIFDDYAVMLFGDKLYVGLAGFGDFALDNPGTNPYYYGGNFKTSLKLTEVMSLNAEQQVLFAKDPRTFMQQVNLDFTGYNPDLNQNFNITANGANKNYERTQVGPSFNIQRLLDGANKNPNSDAFTMDLFFANTSGTDDINQQSIGASILKGFTLRDDSGKPWMVIQNKTTGELGTQYNTLTDRLSVTLPNQGIVVSGQGQILGTAQAYYGEISKKLGDNATVALGYGSPYVGMNNRLSLTMNTSFTLGQLWQSVVDHSKEDLKGGATLKEYNHQLDDFFKAKPGEKPAKSVEELKRVFEQDVARKLIEQGIGTTTRDIEELRKAGAIMDNTRVKAMVGYVTNPISNDPTDLAIGGGFTAGTMTELTLTKTQKALIESKSQSLYRDGLDLQERMLDLTKRWQGSVAAIAQAQWDLKMAGYIVNNAPNEAIRKEAEVTASEATERLHQAVIDYNVLSGRNPTDATPFDNLNSADLEALMKEIKKTIEAPDRFKSILHSLDPQELAKATGEGKYDVMDDKDKTLKDRYHSNPFNLIDWIPFIDRFTVGIGAQISDSLSNQSLELGGSIRLPFYDPTSKAADHAYVLETKATIQQMKQAYLDRSLKTQQEIQEARLWKISADAARPALPGAIRDLSNAIRAYRNGLIGPTQLRQAFASWHWYVTNILDADNKAAVADAWAATDESFSKPPDHDPKTMHITSLDQAAQEAFSRSHTREELVLREQSAEEMTKSNDHRIQKAFLDLHVGYGLTATGVGFLPQLGITGIPITPIFGFEFKPEELRELQQQEGQGQTEYYKALQGKLEAGLAVQFYQNVVAMDASARSINVMDGKLLPDLEAAASRAKQAGNSTDAIAAQRKYDAAVMRREQAGLALKQSMSTINYLLGRGADSPLSLDITPDQALASLKEILARVKPVDAQQRVLDARVKTARAVQVMADKDLKKEQLAMEPVSIVVRSLGRLFSALGADTTGDPNVRAAAEVQRLTEERARDDFEKNRQIQLSQVRAQADETASEIARLKQTDAESELRMLALKDRAKTLQADLLALGEGEGASFSRSYERAPGSFTDLKNRLEEKERGISAKPNTGDIDLLDPETLIHQAQGFARYYYARETLGRVPIDKSYAEGWIEVRLRSADTPPETLLRLAELQKQKANNLYSNDLEGATSKADILLADFEANVRMLRWVDGTRPNWMRTEDHDKFRQDINQKLTAEKDQIAALLALDPNTSLDALTALVPQDPTGSTDLKALSDQFLKQIQDTQIERIRQTLFDGGLPAEFGNADDLMNQIKANTLAERMSYKGFTPVAAFGVFRDTKVGGLFLEAPDVRLIQRGLENILSDVLRKDLQSTGRLQELTLKMNQLMSRVEDGSHELEKRRELITAAEADYRAQMGRALQSHDMKEVDAARERVVAAWLAFSDQMVRTKSDFISLVTELEALNEGKSTMLRPLSAGPSADFKALRRDPQGELLDYWADRLLDDKFAADLGPVLDQLAPKDSAAAADRFAKLKEGIFVRADLYRTAKQTATQVLSKDFTTEEKLDLLTRNDVQGKREALQEKLTALLKSLGQQNPETNPAWAKLLAFVRSDIQVQQAESGEESGHAQDLARGLRDAYWHAIPPATYGVDGAFHDLEALKADLVEKREALLESYLTDTDDNPSRFLLRDTKLDEYLKAEQTFDETVVKTFGKDEVKNDPVMYAGLDAMYDVRGALSREIDGTRSGRGMRAIDALIMLEKARLSAARWSHKSPSEIDRVTEALESLQTTKDRWLGKSTDLAPLYALTQYSQDGKRLWTIDGWITTDEMEAAKASPQHELTLRLDTPDGKKDVKGTVTSKDGKWYVDYIDPAAKEPVTKSLEIFGGIDAAEQQKDAAQKSTGDNRLALNLYDRMKNNDFAVTGLDSNDFAALKGAPEGYSVDDIFGPNGKHAQGRVFFFAAPQPGESSNRLHDQLHPLTALRMTPDKYVMVIYNGNTELSRDRFPTLESVKGSAERGAFYRLSLSAKGASDMIAKAEEAKTLQLREGWVDVKLNSFGFSRVDQADQDFENARAAIRAAESDKLSRESSKPGAESRKLSVADFAAQLEKNVAASPDLAAAAARRDANRGKAYTVSDLYQSKDDFSAIQKAFHNADRDLASARKDLASANEKEMEAQKDADAKKSVATTASIEYQKAQTVIRLTEAKELAKTMNPEKDQVAFKSELDKRLAANKDFKAAQEAFDPIAKAYTKAAQVLKDANVKTINAVKAVEEAKAILEHSKTWSLYQSDDLAIALDAQGGVLSAAGHAIYGNAPLFERVGDGQTVRTVTGELLGAVINDKAQLKAAYLSQDEIDKAVPSWTIKSVTMTGKEDKVVDGKSVKPFFRLSHYEATVTEKDQQVQEPVQLSRRYMQERVESADSKVTRTKYYGVMPWNWGSLLLELPRELIGTPMELVNGRDPRQEHYLGRVYMYKLEGGDTEHHGFFRSVAGVLDVLDLLPDHVGRYYDPSQFPPTVQIDSPLKPGQNIMSKDMRYTDKSKGVDEDIHFGAQGAQRVMTQAAEDLSTARNRTLAHFHGGTEELMIAAYRGRGLDPRYGKDKQNGIYEESMRTGAVGDAAVQKALSDPSVSNAPGSDGSGQVVLSAKPDNLGVEQVEKRVDVIPGADQYQAQADALKDAAAKSAGSEADARGKDAALRTDWAKSLDAYAGTMEDRSKLDKETQKIWDRVHELAWRFYAEEAFKEDLAKAKAVVDSIKDQIDFWGKYLNQLEDALAHRPKDPTKPTDPNNPDDPENPFPGGPRDPSGMFWALMLCVLAIGALISSIIWGIIRGRKPAPVPPVAKPVPPVQTTPQNPAP